MLMSTGMITFVPYANENGISPVGTRLGSVGPKHPGEFLDPFALCSIQAFTLQAFVQAINDGMIADLGLTIALRI